MIRYISLFSGIEAASCAWEPLGWEPVAFSEIEPFPCAVLAERFPDVPNLGDITEIDWKEVLERYGNVDLIVGGSPCQSFSVAGKREGLSGESRLMFEYIRAVQEVRPRWFVWENVPGALTSEGGTAFGQLLQEMDGLGYGVAWRVLDSRFFGVPQRRRRVFAVGRLGDIEGPCQVLFEPEMLRWDAPSGNKRWEELSAHARGRAGREASVGLIANKGTASRSSGAEEESPTVLANSHPPATAFPWSAAGKAAGFGAAEGLSPTLRATRCGEPAVCVQGTIANGKRMGQNGLGASEGACYTLDTMDVHGVCYSITPGISNTARGNGVYEDAAPTLRAVANSNPPAVCYAQNQRCEVRQSGDGSTCGAIPASQSGKQFDFVRLPATQYGEDMTGTLLARIDGSPCDNKGPNVVCVASTQANAEQSEDCSPCLTSHLAKDPSVVCMADDNAHAAADTDVCGTLKVGGGRSLCCLPSNGEGWVGTLCARDSKGVGSQFAREGKVIAVSDENVPWFEGEPRPDFEYHLRRLTPTECMRLQGFPDGWCDIEFRGKPATDTPKYKAAGNSMTVDVMRWIGLRIEEVELWSFAT